VLAGCGTYIEYRDEVLLNVRLPWELLKRTIPILQRNRIAAFFEGSSKLYVDQAAFGEDPYANSFARELGEDYMDIGDLNPDSNVNKLSVDYRNTTKEVVVSALGADYDIILHDFGNVAELVPKGYSKATGMEWICSYLNIPRSRTYAFGDSANDLAMLRYAGCGIAMGNASIQARTAADYITKPLHEDGIYYGLQHVGLL